MSAWDDDLTEADCMDDAGEYHAAQEEYIREHTGNYEPCKNSNHNEHYMNERICQQREHIKNLLAQNAQLKEELAALKAHNVSLTAALADKCEGCDELATLKEKYRWRRQSEESAPHTYDMVVWARLDEDDCCGIWEGNICCGRCVPKSDDVFWRPLDLPEEESK